MKRKIESIQTQILLLLSYCKTHKMCRPSLCNPLLNILHAVFFAGDKGEQFLYREPVVQEALFFYQVWIR